MTQTLKKTLILILSALLSISALFFVAPTIAKADTAEQEQYFTADEGCRLKHTLKESKQTTLTKEELVKYFKG